jgi:MFS transporter, ACS family, tartrate transporter
LDAEDQDSHARAGHTMDAWRALRDPRVLALAAILFGTSAGLYALGLWSPLILQQFSFSPVEIGWINAVPGVLASAGMIAWARHSDRTLERTWHVVLPCAAACVGFLWVGGASTAIAVILALVIAGVGINAAKPPLWAMPKMFLSGASAAAGIAWINSVSNLGGFVGPYAIGWMKDEWGSYAGGLYVVGATLAASAVITLVLSHQLRRRAAPPAEQEP